MYHIFITARYPRYSALSVLIKFVEEKSKRLYTSICPPSKPHSNLMAQPSPLVATIYFSPYTFSSVGAEAMTPTQTPLVLPRTTRSPLSSPTSLHLRSHCLK